jgi:hypothetical protein
MAWFLIKHRVNLTFTKDLGTVLKVSLSHAISKICQEFTLTLEVLGFGTKSWNMPAVVLGHLNYECSNPL